MVMSLPEGEGSQAVWPTIFLLVERVCDSRSSWFSGNVIPKQHPNRRETVVSKFDVIRAWKDEVYRGSLSAEQRAALPAHPIGAMELDDAQLDAVAGATDGQTGCCPGPRSNNCTGTKLQ
jgi:mersacidin/lichenicidin family type 2 lantibiotic